MYLSIIRDLLQRARLIQLWEQVTQSVRLTSLFLMLELEVRRATSQEVKMDIK